jgi:hypothetical protein
MSGNAARQIESGLGGSATERLRVASDGVCNADPLIDFGFRYDLKRRLWRRLGQFHRRLPTSVSRALVAESVGVTEKLLEQWECAVTKDTQQPASAAEALSAGVKTPGKLNVDPLVSFGFRYFPRSKTWRRARADRNEVGRDVVARKTAVPVELIEAWEHAACEAAADSEGAP